jgi:hypothetical protein
MKNVIEIINEAILDVCANPLVENGVFNPDDNEHVFLLIENLDGRLEEEYIAKAVSALRCEGKYPERQAYNKEGWLVTFPSREYRDAAIKRGTHALSDPTHGKGGMNLYYKRRGKQKRMRQQTQTGIDSGIVQQAQPTAPDPATRAAPVAPKDLEPQATVPQESPPAAAPTKPQKGATADIKPEDNNLPTIALAKQPSAGGGVSSGETSLPPSDTPEPEKPKEPAVKKTSNKDISEKFAASKGWESTPYGEWRDKSGAPVGVVSLSGEVTPIKSTDREELKLFADKQA